MECFCGCGAEVKGFSSRGINKQGKRTVGLLAKLEQAQEMKLVGGVKHPKRTLMYVQMIGDLDLEEELERIRAEQPDSDNPLGIMVAEVIDGLLAEGERYRSFWHSALHEGYVPPDAWATKRAWEKWGPEGMSLCRAIGVPIARAGAWRGDF